MKKTDNTPKILSEDEFEGIWLGNFKNNSKYKDYYQRNRVIFENVIVEEGVFIYDLHDEYLPDILILNSSLKIFKIENLKAGNITILNSKIESIELEKSVIGNIKLDKLQGFAYGYLFSMTCGEVILEDFDIRKNIEFQNCHIASFSIQNYSKKMNISIDDWSVSSTIAKLYLKAESSTRLTVEKTKIGELNFQKGIIAKDSFIQILYCEINELHFNSVSNLGSISLQGVNPVDTFNKWRRNPDGHDYYRDGEHNYSVEKIEQKSSIGLFYSDLGKMSIIGGDLEKFSSFYFVNTKMLEVFITGTRLPILTNNRLTNTNKEQERLAYGQFKKIFENRGDAVTASFYQAKELDIYRKQLKEQKEIKRFSKEWSDNIGERCNLWLNQNTNYYGNNWLKSAFITLCATFLFFTIYCILLGNRLGNDFDRFAYLFSYSLEFINPLRRSSELEGFIKPMIFIRTLHEFGIIQVVLF